MNYTIKSNIRQGERVLITNCFQQRHDFDLYIDCITHVNLFFNFYYPKYYKPKSSKYSLKKNL